MARPHKKLRDILHQQEITMEVLAGEIGIATCTMSQKMNSHHPWTAEEMWKIMDILGIPDNRLHEIFPRKGRDELEATRKVYHRAV